MKAPVIWGVDDEEMVLGSLQRELSAVGKGPTLAFTLPQETCAGSRKRL